VHQILLRQGLAVRGYVEDEGNLVQLLKLRASDVDDLFEWMKEKKYLYISHDIINEICQIIFLSIVRKLVKEVEHFLKLFFYIFVYLLFRFLNVKSIA
jgi:hypothetical protein